MMTFKEFIQLDELNGLYGNVPALRGPMGVHSAIKKSHVPATRKGTTSVGRALSAGKFRSPSRPAVLEAPNKPGTIPSVL